MKNKITTDQYTHPWERRAPAPPTPEPAAKPIPTQSELVVPVAGQPTPTTYITVEIQEQYCTTNWTMQYTTCVITFDNDQAPEPTPEEPPTEPEPVHPEPTITPNQQEIPSVCYHIKTYKTNTYAQVIKGMSCPDYIKSCRAITTNQTTSLQPTPVTNWLGLLAYR